MLKELESLLIGNWLSDLANFSAFFYHRVPGVSWIGFYLDDGSSLKLGPFQGKIACTDIAYTRGVCGASFTQRKTLIVEDVHEFPGHIACDPESRSEIVIPIQIGEEIIGVLDVDSKEIGRFSEEERDLFEKGLEILISKNPGLRDLRSRL